jgi:hypothetical protein
VGRWVGMRVAHFKFIAEWVNGEESTFYLILSHPLESYKFKYIGE